MNTSTASELVLFGKLADVQRAINIVRRTLEHNRTRLGSGPYIAEARQVTEPHEEDDHIDFMLIIQQRLADGTPYERMAKLRFKITDDRRNSSEQRRGTRDLRMQFIWLRVRDCFSQIKQRIQKCIDLVISDCKRHLAFLRHNEPYDNDFDHAQRKWRRKRRHWCQRESYSRRFGQHMCMA